MILNKETKQNEPNLEAIFEKIIFLKMSLMFNIISFIVLSIHHIYIILAWY